jgi:hypothetical protein
VSSSGRDSSRIRHIAATSIPEHTAVRLPLVKFYRSTLNFIVGFTSCSDTSRSPPRPLKNTKKMAQKSPARVVYVVRKPRPDASVAVRSERPGVSRKCSPTLWLKWCSSRSSARLSRSPRSQRRSALVFPTSSPALVKPRAAGSSNSSTLTVVLQSARWSPGVEIKVESGRRTLHIRSRRGYTISYASSRASRAPPSAPRCVYSCTV